MGNAGQRIPLSQIGTVEIRIFDTPLTLHQAAALAAYVQTLSRYLLAERPFPIDETLYAVYTFNRFQAARFGFAGGLIDPVSRQKRLLRDDFIETLARIAPHAAALDTALFLESLKGIAESGNDARWMRETYARSQSLPDLVWRQAQRWRDQP